MKICGKHRIFLALSLIAACLPAPASAQKIEGMVWTAGKCQPARQTNSSLGAGVLGVLLGPLIEAGIKGVGNALVKAGSPGDIHAAATYDTNLYSVTLDVPAAPLGAPVVVPTSAIRPPRLSFARNCLVAAFGPLDGDLSTAVSALRADITPLDANRQLDQSVTTILDSAFVFDRMSLIVLHVRRQNIWHRSRRR